jgi:hypothetical protein
MRNVVIQAGPQAAEHLVLDAEQCFQCQAIGRGRIQQREVARRM